ncbi:MAG: nitrate- and nitrite sensing domain-containing protein, partial [Cyclobacteriaceae bacterium]|nr:nitrate- and nitrite sensing domain-containing protein [Cyclobacteriaceae bacterium HetDA_MAG_MS6]
IVGIEINHVVHEIQRERAISSGFISNEGFGFTEQLQQQRSQTDKVLQQFYKEIDGDHLGDLLEFHGDDLVHLRSSFERLQNLREQIDAQSLSPDQSLDYFSDINTIALNTVNDLINETRDKDVAQQVHAIIYFLKAKELASIERAIGTQAFSHDSMHYDLYSRFTALVASQESYIDAFFTIADIESRDYYTMITRGPDVDEVNRLRNILIDNVDLSADPEHWYRVYTNKINLLKKVEDFMSESVHARTEKISGDAVRDFWTFLALDILLGALALWMMTTIVSNLLENVSTLEAFTKRIAKSDYTEKVEIATRDEIGQYAKTFNAMVEEIRKSHIELKRERDKARYLYRNIYKVALVVFENIQQGIFLLDNNFRISKLYSKSMEGIFSNEKIAGENFANFMRPLILPREVEALEMFMKHLFNGDIDEDVVNQLNPIEQVKIYTEKDGIVSSKYIRVTFNRIVRKNRIQNIMVTISDETESVLLQQHLEEAERNKKQETEQVLSILKIDPSILRGFLHNSRNTLKAISSKYEAEQENNLRELLDFTFDTIHNLKGNAVVIGLELMSGKFHDIEETLEKLKEKDVTSKDFLTILYEIDEADKMLQDMNDMLRKVANIYRKHPSGGHIVSNIMVIDALEKGVENISEEMKKPVDFFFRNDKNLVIPEKYINPFKDMMIQLIRNSLSHGIEKQGERLASGKLVKGSINIELDQLQDDRLIIKYYDDGKGLDLAKIKEQAVLRDLVTELQAKKLGTDKIVELIFNKGFSTYDHVDEHAGRGRGMSLVKSIIDEQKGTYEIKFEEGKYFEIVIDLPFGVEEEKETQEA